MNFKKGMAPNLIRETLARKDFSKENIQGKLFFRIFFLLYMNAKCCGIAIQEF